MKYERSFHIKKAKQYDLSTRAANKVESSPPEKSTAILAGDSCDGSFDDSAENCIKRTALVRCQIF